MLGGILKPTFSENLVSHDKHLPMESLWQVLDGRNVRSPTADLGYIDQVPWLAQVFVFFDSSRTIVTLGSASREASTPSKPPGSISLVCSHSSGYVMGYGMQGLISVGTQRFSDSAERTEVRLWVYWILSSPNNVKHGEAICGGEWILLRPAVQRTTFADTPASCKTRCEGVPWQFPAVPMFRGGVHSTH